jgi:hypothetical protein
VVSEHLPPHPTTNDNNDNNKINNNNNNTPSAHSLPPRQAKSRVLTRAYRSMILSAEST